MGPVRYKIQGPAEKPAALALSISYDQAPVPSHYYVADYFAIIPQDLEVLIVFGKREQPSADTLRSKIEIYFPSEIFVKQLWRTSREFHQIVGALVEKLGSSAVAAGQSTALVEKVQTLHSNNVLMVLMGTECVMDFFYISPKEMWAKPKRGEEIEIEALVRIITPPNLVLGFLEACEPIVTTLQQRFASHLSEDDSENLESN